MSQHTRRETRSLPKPSAALLALLTLGAGCSGGLDVPASVLDETNGLTSNDLSTSGLITNGLITNGLITNGLAENGLWSRGFTSEDFTIWFDSNPPHLSNTVMSYVVSCAVAAGQVRSWTHPKTGVTYVWSGSLDLAPGWANGSPVTEVEQQLITACLAARVNKYGRFVLISILGENSLGTPIPVEAAELTQFSEPEGAFFGNLFTGDEAIYACSDRCLNNSESTERACGLSSQRLGTSLECPPIIHVGDCRKDALCERDPTRKYYQVCKYGEKHYRALTTRLSPTSIYRCGDGICQFTESCGQHNSYDDCRADCGPC